MESFIIALFFCILISSAHSKCDADWSYDGKHGKGPEKWGELFEKCGHLNQSPINIDTGTVVYDEKLTKVTLDDYFKKPENHTMMFSNNGHTVVVTLTGDFLVHGGGLDVEYKAKQFHFHWGKNNSRGSEHTISDKAFPMELHIVHYNTNFSSFENAIDKPYGLAVLGFMFEIVEKPNPNYEWLTNYSKEIKNCDTEFELPPFMMDDLLAHDTEHYYRYFGSLTTPPCHESAVWTVFHESIKISQDQLDTFRKLLETKAGETPSKKMVDNFRPIQPLNNRTVYTSVKPNPPTTPRGPVGSASVVEANAVIVLAGCFILSELFRQL